jgi:glycosyltransferase involved in cell wall biosynthesis
MTNRIRVLELRSVRGTGGGPEKTILSGAALAGDLFDVTVCYIRDLRDRVFGIDERARQLGVDYTEITERHSYDTAAWQHVFSLVRAREIHIVHAHDYKTNLMAFAASRRTQATALSTVHGWTGQSFRERRVYYPLDKRVLARFPRLVAVSGEIKRELIRHGASDGKVTVLLNGIDSHLYCRNPSRRSAVRAALGLGSDDVVIGAVGRLERQKRFDLLLEALQSLAAGHPLLKLVVVGDGSLRGELERHASQLQVDSRCVWTGHRNDVADLHHAFDLFVQSSEYEGTPNAVLEAMAMGTPIIATDAGGTREVAAPGIHALIVPVGNVRELHDAIEAVLTNRSAASSRAASARQRIEHELSFETRTRRLEAIYAELAARRHSGRGLLTRTAEAHRA